MARAVRLWKFVACDMSQVEVIAKVVRHLCSLLRAFVGSNE